MKMTYKFNGVQLTDETIQQTRQWFYDNCMTCIKEVEEGKYYVNDLDEYRKWELKSATNYIEGKNDHTLSFLQRAYYIQFGESIPLINFK